MAREIPLPKSVYRSKKASLLKMLKHELHTLLIQEDMLEKLEVLEELDRGVGSPVSAAMSAAYCAIAVECTLLYLGVPSLDDSLSNESGYVKAINRIWRGRVPYMEPSATSVGSQLFSAELKQWSKDIEASLWDSGVRERLETFDSRRDAIRKLKACLAEASEDLATSFLEAAANRSHDAVPLPLPLPTHTTEVRGHERESGPTSSPAQLQRVKYMNLEPPLENQTTEAPIENHSTDAPTENQCTDASIHSIENRSAVAPTENQIADADFREQQVCHAACTHEWDESADGLHGGASVHASKFHLPSPKGNKISPLKKYEPQNIMTRRKRKKWSELEEETLRTAVNQYGEGNWKLILNSHKDIFAERTQVDLKDKWRNFTRYGAK